MEIKLDIPLINKKTPVVTPLSANHPTGDAFFKNNIPLVSPQYDADVKTGRALALGATNDLAIPIHNNGGANSFLTYHDIANDEVIQIGNTVDGGSSKELVENGTFDSNTDSWTTPSANGTKEAVGGECVLTNDSNLSTYTQQEFSVNPGSTYFVSCDYKSGTLPPRFLVYDGTTIVNNVSDDTPDFITKEFIFISTQPTMRVRLQTNGGAGDGNSIYDNVSVKEILPTSTTYTFNDVTLNNILTHQMAFSEGDLTLIQQEPNLLAALALGEATPISSVTLDADDSWYACSEASGADVFDARVAGNDTTISGDLTSVRLTNQQKGLQTTALLLDGAGIPESYNSTANTARVYDDTIISTGFKPSIARYSIEESVSGELADLDANGDPLGTFSQRTEARVLSHGPVDGDKLYIDTVLQGYAPPLPDPNSTINLNNVAVIGYPDTIESREANFNIHSDVITP